MSTRKYSPKDQFLFAVMALQSEECIKYIGGLFGFSKGYASKVYDVWVGFLSGLFDRSYPYPPRWMVAHIMPDQYKKVISTTLDLPRLHNQTTCSCMAANALIVISNANADVWHKSCPRAY